MDLRQTLRTALDSAVAHVLIIALTVVDVVLITISIVLSSLGADEKESTASEVVAALSLAIICVFVLEIVLAIVAFGPAYLYGGPDWKFHLVDAIVICTSLVLEVTIRGDLAGIAELIVLFRLWRVARLVSVLLVKYGERVSARLARATQRIAELELENYYMRHPQRDRSFTI